MRGDGLAAPPPDAGLRPREGARRRLLVACHELSPAGGLYRFERVGRAIGRFGHHLAFVAFAEGSRTGRETDVPVLSPEEAARQTWDATHVPGAGFPAPTIEAFARLRGAAFGVRVQHVLNDRTHEAGFLHVNRTFAPHRVVFNNRHWRPGDFTGFAAREFHVLEGAVDVEGLAPDPARAARRPGRPFAVGGLANKNVEPLIEAVLGCDEVHLHLFGADHALPPAADDLAAAGRLHRHGILGEEALRGFYAGLDCVAHTETFAGWANLAAEAMASGVPVVCTPHGTLPFAEHEASALVVETPSPAALAAAILRLRDDPRLAARLARRGRERIAPLSWPLYAQDLLGLCEHPAYAHDTWSPDLGLHGTWPEAWRLDGLWPILDACAGATVLDLGARDGAVARRLLERGAALVHGVARDPDHVALARRVCADYPAARFEVGDPSDWTGSAAAEFLRARYDVVLGPALPRRLPPAARRIALTRAAGRAAQTLAVRVPPAVYEADAVEAVLGTLGFAPVSAGGECRLFRRRRDPSG